MHLSWLLLLPLGALGKDSYLKSPLFSQPANDTQSLLWGPYRPNLYFGLRPRLPQSLMTGLMWFGTQDYKSIGRQYIQHFPANNLQADQDVLYRDTPRL
jgi:mannosyl-oligosaccharide glucosidase